MTGKEKVFFGIGLIGLILYVLSTANWTKISSLIGNLGILLIGFSIMYILLILKSK